jgi:hypothetical protein
MCSRRVFTVVASHSYPPGRTFKSALSNANAIDRLSITHSRVPALRRKVQVSFVDCGAL